MLLGHRGSKFRVTQTDARTTPSTSQFTSVNIGPEFAGRWVAIFLVHEDRLSSPGNTPTLTMEGVGATRILAHTTGDGAGKAVGVALFTGQPTGESITVGFNWAVTACTIVVMSVRGYDLSAAHDSASSATSNAITADLPAFGLLLGMAATATVSDDISFVGLTERGEDNTPDQSRAWGWDFPLPLETNHQVTHSPFTSSQGENVKLIASFAAA